MNTFLTICLIVLPLSLLMGLCRLPGPSVCQGHACQAHPQPEHHRLCGVVLLLASCFAFAVKR